MQIKHSSISNKSRGDKISQAAVTLADRPFPCCCVLQEGARSSQRQKRQATGQGRGVLPHSTSSSSSSRTGALHAGVTAMRVGAAGDQSCCTPLEDGARRLMLWSSRRDKSTSGLAKSVDIDSKPEKLMLNLRSIFSVLVRVGCTH